MGSVRKRERKEVACLADCAFFVAPAIDCGNNIHLFLKGAD